MSEPRRVTVALRALEQHAQSAHLWRGLARHHGLPVRQFLHLGGSPRSEEAMETSSLLAEPAALPACPPKDADSAAFGPSGSMALEAVASSDGAPAGGGVAPAPAVQPALSAERLKELHGADHPEVGKVCQVFTTSCNTLAMNSLQRGTLQWVAARAGGGRRLRSS